MFTSKYFKIGFFGFFIAAFLFFTYDVALFDYKLKKMPVVDVLEKKLKYPPNTVSFTLKDDHMLSTLKDGKVENYKTLQEIIKNKNTILFIWSPTCGYCPDQMKKLTMLNAQNAKANIVMIGVYGDINSAHAKHKELAKGDFIYDNDPSLKILRLLAMDLIQSQEIGFPFYVFINKKGEIIARYSGDIAWDLIGSDILRATFN